MTFAVGQGLGKDNRTREIHERGGGNTKVSEPQEVAPTLIANKLGRVELEEPEGEPVRTWRLNEMPL